jgi:hypothetical protein
MKSNKSKRGRSEGETGQLVFRAAEAKREAELARKRARLAKAQYREARKSFKHAKKAAKEARKLAKAASKVLGVRVKSRARKRRHPKKPPTVRSPQPKKTTIPQTVSSSAKPGPGVITPPPNISPPTSAQLS